MKFSDYSPPSSPSLDQQKDALQKGLGRAVQWARTHRLDDEVLLDACMHDKRYDKQCEEVRGEWLWAILQAANAAERFRKSILKSLRSFAAEADAYQLCQLARRYAVCGDSEAKNELYAFVERQPITDCPWVGEQQLLEVGGEDALLFIARIRGRRLKDGGWGWDDSAMVERAIEVLGKERVATLLVGSPDSAIRRFESSWKQNSARPPSSSRQVRSERMRAIQASEVIEAAYEPKRCFWFRGWGRHAEACDLETVVHVLRTARDPTFIAKLLRVFSARALPRFEPWLVNLCRHQDDEVRFRAFGALEMNSHPAVREFALSEIEKPASQPFAIGLFIRNYEPGDEDRLLKALELPDDDILRHTLLSDLLKVLEQNQDADCSKLGVVAYAETPCDICRSTAVELLVNRGVAPGWMTDECQHDSSEHCREIVQKRLRASE